MVSDTIEVRRSAIALAVEVALSIAEKHALKIHSLAAIKGAGFDVSAASKANETGSFGDQIGYEVKPDSQTAMRWLIDVRVACDLCL